MAALETLLALHALLGRRIELELLAPGTHFLNRPAAVAEPFGLGSAATTPIADVAGRCHAETHEGTLAAVRPDDRIAVTDDGAELAYDRLVIAVGARPAETLPGAVRFTGPNDVAGISEVLERAQDGRVRSIAFALQAGVAWTLPLYELAIMTAIELRDRGVRGVELTLVTPERSPLWLFGAEAGIALSGLLRDRDVHLRHGRPARLADGRLVLEDGEAVPADAAVVLPSLHGPAIAGLPADEHGFIPVDGHGRVAGVADVFAAGDATTYPVKQGGLATQQADVVAGTIAAELGAIHTAPPFRPVLRGMLLTGGAPLYLRAELTPEGGVRSTGHARAELHGEVSIRALWWPPGKVAGRYLAPYLATARPSDVAREPLADIGHRPPPDDHDAADALTLALLIADEDARAGDLVQALNALDAAAAVGGGALPEEAARKREAWRSRLATVPR